METNYNKRATYILFIAICMLLLTASMHNNRITTTENRLSTIESDYYGGVRSVDTVSEDGIDPPSWNYDSEITMPHQNRIYDILMGIDGLTDTTKELISQAWSRKSSNLILQVNTLFDEGSLISMSLKLSDNTYITATIQWHSNVNGWELTRWDRVMPDN